MTNTWLIVVFMVMFIAGILTNYYFIMNSSFEVSPARDFRSRDLKQSVVALLHRTYSTHLFQSYFGLYSHENRYLAIHGPYGACPVALCTLQTCENISLPLLDTISLPRLSDVSMAQEATREAIRLGCDNVCDGVCGKVTGLHGKMGSATIRERGLVVVTTCNHLDVSLGSLASISRAVEKASLDWDIVVVDDHSIDGTVQTLRRLGFAVLEKKQATGLTQSWSLGYRLAQQLGYKFVIFSNNDVILADSTLATFEYDLLSEIEPVLLVPITSDKGAGHNPAQGISHAYREDMPNDTYDNYLDDPNNTNRIALAVKTLGDLISNMKKRCPLSKWRNKARFNG